MLRLATIAVLILGCYGSSYAPPRLSKQEKQFIQQKKLQEKEWSKQLRSELQIKCKLDEWWQGILGCNFRPDLERSSAWAQVQRYYQELRNIFRSAQTRFQLIKDCPSVPHSSRDELGREIAREVALLNNQITDIVSRRGDFGPPNARVSKMIPRKLAPTGCTLRKERAAAPIAPGQLQERQYAPRRIPASNRNADPYSRCPKPGCGSVRPSKAADGGALRCRKCGTPWIL